MSQAASSPKLRVLVVTGIFPPDIGGPASYVPALSAELVKRGHEVEVVTLSDSLEHSDADYPFRVRRIRRSLFKPWRFVVTVCAILREGRQSQVLYVNGLYIEALVANILFRKPLIQKIVGDWAWERATNKGWVSDSFEEFQQRSHAPKVELLKALRSLCARRADAVVVPSQYLARAVGRWGVSETKTRVVYNAVDFPSVSPGAIPLSSPFKVVTAGRLVPWKRIDHLIEAVAECEEVGLVIVGDGPERNRLEELVHSRDMTGRVYFAGQRSKYETLSLMAAGDVFVLNSTYEGLPHVVLEAMSLGLPVIATAVGGTPELVHDGENGRLIATASNGALAKILGELAVSRDERQRLAAGARQTVQRFRHEQMIEGTEAALQNRH